jgi:hypothetical protein
MSRSSVWNAAIAVFKNMNSINRGMDLCPDEITAPIIRFIALLHDSPAHFYHFFRSSLVMVNGAVADVSSLRAQGAIGSRTAVNSSARSSRRPGKSLRFFDPQRQVMFCRAKNKQIKAV